MNYQEIWCPDDIQEAGWDYAEGITEKGEQIEGIACIQWEDGDVGFEISILENLNSGNNLNVTRVTLSQIDNKMGSNLAERVN